MMPHHNNNYQTPVLMNGLTASETDVRHQSAMITPFPVELSATPNATSSHVNTYRLSEPMMMRSSARNTCPEASSTSISRRHSTAFDRRRQSMFFEHQLCKDMDIGNLVVDRPRPKRRSFERRGAMDTSASLLDELHHRAQSAPFISNHRSETSMSNSSKQNATWDVPPPPPSNIGGESLKRSNECVNQQKEGPSSKLLKRASMSRENLSKFIMEIVQRCKSDSEEKGGIDNQEMEGNILLAQMISMQDKNIWNSVRGPSDD